MLEILVVASTKGRYNVSVKPGHGSTDHCLPLLAGDAARIDTPDGE